MWAWSNWCNMWCFLHGADGRRVSISGRSIYNVHTNFPAKWSSSVFLSGSGWCHRSCSAIYWKEPENGWDPFTVDNYRVVAKTQINDGNEFLQPSVHHVDITIFTMQNLLRLMFCVSVCSIELWDWLDTF